MFWGLLGFLRVGWARMRMDLAARIACKQLFLLFFADRSAYFMGFVVGDLNKNNYCNLF
jgi:hypothetical protein